MAHFIYGVAENTGKGLLQKTEENSSLEVILQTFDGWYNVDGAMWLAEKNGVEKTKAEAQALIDAEV